MRVKEGFLSVDERGVIRAVDVFAERITGYLASEVVGRNISLLLAGFETSDPLCEGLDVAWIGNSTVGVVGLDRPREWVGKNGRPIEVEILAPDEPPVSGLQVFSALVRPRLVKGSRRVDARCTVLNPQCHAALSSLMSSSALSDDERIRAILAFAAEHTGFEDAALWTLHGQSVRIAQSVGRSVKLYTGLELPISKSPCGQTLDHGVLEFHAAEGLEPEDACEAAMLRASELSDRGFDMTQRARLGEDLIESVSGLQIRSYAGIVVTVRNKPVGVLSLSSTAAARRERSQDWIGIEPTLRMLADSLSETLEVAQFHRDASDDQAAAEELLTHSTLPVIVVNDSGKLVRGNTAWMNLTGQSITAPHRGTQVRAIFTDPGRWDSILSVLSEGREVRDAEVQVAVGYGDVLILRVEAKPLLAGNKMASARVLFRDVTMRRRLQQRVGLLASISEIFLAGRVPAWTLTRIQKLLGDAEGLRFGSVWLPEDASGKDGEHLMRCAGWWLADGYECPTMQASCKNAVLSLGQCLPGMAWGSAKPAARCVSECSGCKRAKAAEQDGLRSSLAIPVMAGGRVLAVLEFYSDRDVAFDQSLIDWFMQVGGYVGNGLYSVNNARNHS